MTDPNRPVTGYPAPAASNGYPAPPPASNGYPAPPPASNGYPAATAYPYPAQNQPSYFNISSNNTYYSNPIHQQRATFLRRIFAVFIACVILFGTIAFIVWLVLRPQLPQFTLQTLTLSNFTLTPSPNTISANWNAQFIIRNPNSKITLYYDHIESAVFYKSDTLSETSLPPFIQGKKNETIVKATFAALSAYVDDWDGINKEKGNGKVEFNLRMVARVRFRAGDWWARRRVLRVYCPDCFVGVSGNGSSAGALMGGSKRCRVGL